MAHEPDANNDGEPIGRYEDALLDRDSDDAARESDRLRAVADPEFARRLVDRQFAHGLLLSEAEHGSAHGERRLRSAMARIRHQSTAAWWSRPRYAAAAAVLLLVAGGAIALAVFTNDPSPAPIVTQPDPEPVEVTLSYDVVSGQVDQFLSVGGTWRIASSGSNPATIRIGDGLATFSPGTEVTVDATGRNFELRRGSIALEGKGMRLPHGSGFATLDGGPVVLSDGTSGGMIELFSGRLVSESGEDLLPAGHSLRPSGEPIPLSAVLLPEWVAQGRAEDSFQELNSLANGRLTDQKDAWIETLRPMLAEPLTRAMVLQMVHRSLDGTLTDAEVREMLEFFGLALSELRQRAEERGDDYEHEVAETVSELVLYMASLPEQTREVTRRHQRGMIEHWNGLSEEERAEVRKVFVQVIDNYRQARKRARNGG